MINILSLSLSLCVCVCVYVCVCVLVKRRKKEAEELEGTVVLYLHPLLLHRWVGPFNYLCTVFTEHSDDGSLPHPLSDLYLAVPAAMTAIVHCVTLLANLLDRPLPYPTVLPLALW